MRAILRRVVALGAVMAAALTGAGCSGSSDAPGRPEVAALDEGKATGPVEVWAAGTEGQALVDFVRVFTQLNPQATVQVTVLDPATAQDQVAAAAAAGNGPDVALVGSTWIGALAAGGALDRTPDAIDPNAYFPGAWASVVVGGVPYGQPWFVETRVLYVNRSLADEGQVSATPATWGDLTATTLRLQQAGARWGIELPPGGTDAWQTFLPFAWQAGAPILGSDGSGFALDSAPMVDALAYYQSFFTTGVAATTVDPDSPVNALAAGEIGSFISGPQEIEALRQAGGDGLLDHMTITPLPQGLKDAAYIGGGDLVVLAGATNRDAAWKLVQWLAEPDTQTAWYRTTGSLPAVRTAWQSGDLADDPLLGAFATQLEYGVAPPAIPHWQQVADVIDSELVQLATGGLSPQDAAAAMQQQAEQIGTGT